jgi:hypothetical protein
MTGLRPEWALNELDKFITQTVMHNASSAGFITVRDSTAARRRRSDKTGAGSREDSRPGPPTLEDGRLRPNRQQPLESPQGSCHPCARGTPTRKGAS